LDKEVKSLRLCGFAKKFKHMKNNEDFNYLLEQFSDLKILRYKVPGFENLSLKQKKLVYYLSEAALCGRDVIFDQNYVHNLKIRKVLETIYQHFQGDRSTEEFKQFIIYLKRVWFSNGIHHHYSTDKFPTGFSEMYFDALLKGTKTEHFPKDVQQNLSIIFNRVKAALFHPDVAPKRVSMDSTTDLVKSSACNFYMEVTEKEAEQYYSAKRKTNDKTPVSFGLNSRLVKEDGQIKEEVYKIGGKYSPALEKIVYWLEKAAKVAENHQQELVIKKLIDFYKTGDLKTFDEYNVLWVNDLDSTVDFVNGFTEVYGDPLGMKATWESVVNFKDVKATKRTEVISRNAQWFEDHSPVHEKFKKKQVKGISARVITVAQLGGDCYPSTPIGINLPNADWIRKEHGSKSVTMDNISYAYDQASLGSGFLEEFTCDEEEVNLSKKYGFLAGSLHTDLHECLGHGSGQLLPGVSPEALKNYGSALEEARADLFALYYLMDKKMIDLNLIPSLDVAKTEYNGYIRNGLMTQLVRIELGKSIEQAHMRNRQLIAKWCFEKGKKENVIECTVRNTKTYFKINDYSKLRNLFGVLLAEVQRIKSEGDYEAGKRLVENYGVQIDPVLHKEVKDRFEKLNIAPYGGFVNPRFKLIEMEGTIVDVEIEYSDDYSKQMLEYSENYSYL
jgi:dipeptidyl-peptidase-3